MFDVNHHPRQASLNHAIGKVLANSVISLKKVSQEYQVDGIELAKQFRAVLDKMIEGIEAESCN